MNCGGGPSPSRVTTPGIASDYRAQRFLLLWFFSYLVFFSFAATKLPPPSCRTAGPFALVTSTADNLPACAIPLASSGMGEREMRSPFLSPTEAEILGHNERQWKIVSRQNSCESAAFGDGLKL